MCRTAHNVTADAQGTNTVTSARGPECHAASYYCATCVQSKRRSAINDDILRFWESQGVARTSCPRNKSCALFARDGKCARGWHARDMVNGGDMWLPMATQGERYGFAEFSHIIPAVSGAYCACNLLPEDGGMNAARGDMPITELSPSATALLAAWPAWWAKHVARKASLARLGM